MKRNIENAILALGEDPGDAVWSWLASGGPHGSSFTWGQSRNSPPGYVGIEHLETIVVELASSIPDFMPRARTVVSTAMGSELPSLVRRAIQVAAVVGQKLELAQIIALQGHADSDVAADARASAFYLKKRL